MGTHPGREVIPREHADPSEPLPGVENEPRWPRVQSPEADMNVVDLGASSTHNVRVKKIFEVFTGLEAQECLSIVR